MLTGKQLRDCLISAGNNIENQKASVNELNVFPVPDGDTGTNMSMTMGFAVRELKLLDDSCGVDVVASTASSALLRGARGNSGVILSLIFRGFGKTMQGSATADATMIAMSLQKGVEAAYKAVMKPTEGTILTVAREAAQEALKVADGKTPLEIFDVIIAEAERSLERTPELLPVLKKAGVVDSGGCGFVIIMKGMMECLRTGKIIPLEGGEPESAAEVGRGVYAEGVGEELTESYCTEFIVIKDERANAIALRAYLESIGDSVVVVEDDEIIKCHVHTKTPNKALESALKNGYLTKIKIENMLEQYKELHAADKQKPEKQQPAAVGESFAYAEKDENVKYGVVAVCSGEGLEKLFADMGVDRIVSGGQTMNPSTEDILAAIQSVPAENVIVLANNKNIIMSAEQACSLADRNSVTLPTRSVPAGVSAMLMFNPEATLEQNLIDMKEAADAASVGQVTFAARDSDFDGKKLHEGQILALEGSKLLYVENDVQSAVVKLTKKLCVKGKSYVTVTYGRDVSDDDATAAFDAIKKKLPGTVECNLINGGQPVYYYYVCAE